MENKSVVVSSSDADWIKYFRKNGEIDYIQIKYNRKRSSLIGKFNHLVEAGQFIKYLIIHRKTINQYQSLIVIGNNVALATILLRKLNILKNPKVVWWGFFLHSSLSINVYRLFHKLFESKHVVYVLYSYFEKELYYNILGKKTLTLVLPYGIWNDDISVAHDEKKYYFSGGYSNRDYISLIDAFRNTSFQLVIIASKLNKELNNIQIPDNITILRDVDKDIFHDYMDHAQGVIIPLKNNLGASGQMVTLNAMARGKLIVINDNSIMKEYVVDKESGYVVQDIKKELIQLLEKIEKTPTEKKRIQENVRQRFLEVYSRKQGIKNIETILKTLNKA